MEPLRESYKVAGLHVDHVAPPGGPKDGRPPLLLVHGSGHGAWCWELWMEALPALGWEAFALSLRRHPGSGGPEDDVFWRDTTVADYADDVATVAAHVGRPAVTIGHSMGGIVTQAFVSRAAAPGRPEPYPAGMVLLASVGPGALGPIREEPMPVDRPYRPSDELARQRYFHTAPPDVVARALERLVPESPAVTNEYSLAPGVAIDPASVTCPVLVVTAEHDGTPVPRGGVIAEYYGGTWLHDPDIGHDVMLEAGWEPLMGKVLDWVTGSVPPAGR